MCTLCFSQSQWIMIWMLFPPTIGRLHMYRIADKRNTEVNNKYIRNTEIYENRVKLDFKEYKI